jgi:hypothetical protein
MLQWASRVGHHPSQNGPLPLPTVLLFYILISAPALCSLRIAPQHSADFQAPSLFCIPNPYPHQQCDTFVSMFLIPPIINFTICCHQSPSFLVPFLNCKLLCCAARLAARSTFHLNSTSPPLIYPLLVWTSDSHLFLYLLLLLNRTSPLDNSFKFHHGWPHVPSLHPFCSTNIQWLDLCPGFDFHHI